ncbi:MAG: hydantoinase/oxoprolinase family protein, partial [Gemmataceae bacterium]
NQESCHTDAALFGPRPTSGISTVTILGLDIGGANIKAASTDHRTVTLPFPLWKQPAELPRAIQALVAQFAPAAVAITMTGELCDCFRTKRDGVRHIVEAAESIGSIPRAYYGTDGQFHSATAAIADPLRVASANWHATATFVSRFLPEGTGLLLDIGSTTTDIIPIQSRIPRTVGTTDITRLQSGELIYTGVRRTFATTLLGPSYAAEYFATAHDAYLLLGDVAEDPADTDTADSQPCTREAAHARLSRMLCGDPELVPHDTTRQLAEQMIAVQVALIQKQLRTLQSTTMVLAGSGECLARRVLATLPTPPPVPISLQQKLGPELSTAAPAYAVAELYRELRR